MTSQTFPTLRERAMAMSGELIAPELALVDLSGGVMIFADGSMSVGFSCTAPICGLLPDDARANVFQGLRTAFRTLPDDACVQIHFGQQSRVIDVAAALNSGNAEQPLVRLAIERRNKMFTEAIQNAQLRLTTLDVYINVPSVVDADELSRRLAELSVSSELEGQPKPEGLLGALGTKFREIGARLNAAFNPLRGAVVISLEEYQDTRLKLMRAAEGMQASLYQAGLDPVPMKADNILGRLYRTNNPSKFQNGLTFHPYSPEKDIPVSELYLSSNFEWDPSGKNMPRGVAFVDGYYHQLLTLRMPPGTMSFPHFEGVGMFLGAHEMEVIVNITAGDVTRRIGELEEEERAILNNTKSATGAAKLGQISAELANLGSGEEKIWKAQHIFVVRSRNLEQLSKQVMTLTTAAQRAEAAELVEESPALLQYWRAIQPGWCRDQDLHRHNIYNTSQLVSMLPSFGGSALNPKKKTGAVFETADGSLLNIFPGDTQEFTVGNLIVTGRSGSGKSVLANSLFTHLARHKPRLIIVDIGASYRRFCESVDGTFLEYNIKSNECRINPFDVFAGRTADMAEIQGVILLLEKMVAEPSRPELTGAERAVIEDALNTLIRNRDGKTFFMTDFKTTLDGFGTTTSRDLGIRISRFCVGGTYGNLFDGSTRVPSSGRTTVFELYHLRNNAQELLPVVFQSLIQHIISLSNNYPDDIKILGLDEAHVMLQDPILRKFVDLAFRTFRKLGVHVVGVSQGVGDWVVEGNKMAILNNVGGFFACNMTPGAVLDMKELLHLSGPEAASLNELQVVPGTMSEFMSVRLTAAGRRSTVCVNRLTPLEYAMFTTDPADTAVIYRWTSTGGITLSAAIERFASKYPRGVRLAGGPATEDAPPDGN